MADERFVSGLDEAEVRDIWDRNAEVWIRQVRAGRDHTRADFNNPAFLGFVGDLAGRDVIDLGCGEGTNTRLFAQQGTTMTGVDLSPRLIAAAEAAEHPCLQSTPNRGLKAVYWYFIQRRSLISPQV